MNPVCEKKDRCGGCQYMGIAYPVQLQQKQQQMQKLFPDLTVQPVLGMADPYHYRHKIYASFGYDRQRKLMAGMYEEDSHIRIANPDCLIQNELANRIIRSFCQIAGSMHLQPYQEDSGNGVLRHLYLRVSHATGRVLLTIVIGSPQLPGSRQLVQRLIRQNPEIESIVLNWNSRHTSMVLGERDRILYGSGSIEDQIGGIRFRISPHSFYQVNPVQTELLYQKVLVLAKLQPGSRVLDLCCGIGTISLLAAKTARSVTGVEIVKQAVEDARYNARINHLTNARFICADAEQYMANLREPADIVFLDPPRCGFSEKFLRQLSAVKPHRIVYISCNPETQARDLQVMKACGYQGEQCMPIDLFPFTNHTETIVLISKIKQEIR